MKGRKPQYSLLLSGRSALSVSDKGLERLFRAGVKCLMFLPEARAREVVARFGTAYGGSCCKVYAPMAAELPDLSIADGHMTAAEKAAAEALGRLSYRVDGPAGLLDFNWEQYAAEHAPAEENMIVRASAGTGKTTVMMDRVLFLFGTVEGLGPEDVGMITFTNAAAAHMVEKLEERLGTFYRETGAPRFLRWMERLPMMRVQTIDSFFKRILAEEGSWLGYGRGASVRGFVQERKDALMAALDEIFRASVGGRDADFLQAFVLSRSAYVQRAYDFWMRLEARGFSADDIAHMDFGGLDSEEERVREHREKQKERKYQIVSDTLKEMIVRGARRYAAAKRTADAYALGDIRQEMAALARSGCDRLRETRLRVLFIDEFQDTDNSQIASVAWLQHVTGCRMFVVGDVKQSIYRFRGAEENAFDELRRQMKEKGAQAPVDYVLRKNYRTSADVLQSLDEAFLQLGRAHWLPYTKKESVVPCIHRPGALHLCKVPRTAIPAACRKLAQTRLRAGKEVAILCRSNWQAAAMDEACRAAGVASRVRRSGGFWQYGAVRDFLALVRALLYPGDVAALCVFALTPYVSTPPDPAELAARAGRPGEQAVYLRGLLAADGWHAVLEALPHEPAFPFLLRTVLAHAPAERYRARELGALTADAPEEDRRAAERTALMYALNLNKLFQLLGDHFTGEFASLLAIHDFVAQHVETDGEEDVLYPAPSSEEGVVEIMTVHKAKGLEFQTVLVPYMGDAFVRDEEHNENYCALFTDAAGRQAAMAFWQRGTFWENEHFLPMHHEEAQAVTREAARLLYVAATRCKEELVCFWDGRPPRKSGCWGLWTDGWRRVGEGEEADGRGYRIYPEESDGKGAQRP